MNQLPWISVNDRMPEEETYVLVWYGAYAVAKLVRGISEEERMAMKRGEIDDPIETVWSASSGYVTQFRSSLYKSCDVFGNNTLPYMWVIPTGGTLYGQNVTHWLPLPASPNVICNKTE